MSLLDFPRAILCQNDFDESLADRRQKKGRNEGKDGRMRDLARTGGGFGNNNNSGRENKDDDSGLDRTSLLCVSHQKAGGISRN